MLLPLQRLRAPRHRQPPLRLPEVSISTSFGSDAKRRLGPVIVTVVPQPNTSIVVVASEGTTRTVTRGSQTRTAESPTATEAEQPAGEAEEREFPRSTTVTTSKGAVQTAVGASAGDETRP